MKTKLLQYAKTLTVLFVEDDTDAREMGGEVFGLLFGKVYLAKNGKEGLDVYFDKKPDIIITDIQMPVMDGLAMIKEIRKEDTDIPIVITTAHSDEKYFMESIKAGVDRYILKPIVKDECMDAVFAISKRLLDQKDAEECNAQKAEKEIEAAKQETLRQSMYFDRLTGLPNRFSLMELLANTPAASLVLFNIDRIKDVNRIYGVKIGDDMILRVAEMLFAWSNNRCGFKLFAMGADEFAIFFLEACQSELESSACEVIYKIESEPFIVDDLEINISATAGIACNSKRPIEDAEAARRIAKQKKINFFIYEEQLLPDEKQVNNILWYQKIKEALKDDRIIPFYQPIVSTETTKISKYECLIRFIELDEAIVSPYHFLEIAKQTRLYAELTKAVIRKSIEHFMQNEYEFSINLSVEDMSSQEVADFIVSSVKKSGIGNRIVFEILESEGIENFEEVSCFIDKLKVLGCRFAIDDFGTGYSNVIYLLKLNVDYLKIDGSLIQKLPFDENVRKAVSSIHSFAHSIGIKTIAEFVSDEKIFLEVTKIGIDYCQGYYFSQPIRDIKQQGAVI